MYLILGILGGFSVFIGFITIIALTGNHMWRRHREKNDPLKYKGKYTFFILI